MRIVHIMFSGPWAEGMRYQENLLPEAQARLGHEVCLITGCRGFADGREVRVAPCDTRLADGVRLIRLPFRFGGALGDKLRDAPGLYEALCALRPDWIMLHEPQTRSVYALRRYLRENPGVVLVLDNHGDAYNSATNPLSKYILHRLLYRRYVRAVSPLAARFYGVTDECMRFCTDNYGVPPEKLELLPLGGELPDEESYRRFRAEKRAELGLEDDALLLLHSGKFTAEKRSAWLLEAMAKLDTPKLRLVLIGSIPDDALRERVREAEERDARIRFLGWKSGGELMRYLCAADVYVQPGTQSATMQNAACCRCALLLRPYPSHRLLLGDAALYAEDAAGFTAQLRALAEDSALLRRQREAAFALAREKLDYSAQARMLCAIGRERT